MRKHEPKPERRIGYAYYPTDESGWGKNKINSRIDLVFETWGTKKRVWRIMGSEKELSDEWVAKMIKDVREGKAKLIYNKYFHAT